MSEKSSSTGLERADTIGAKIRSMMVLVTMILPLALLTYIVDKYADGTWRLGLLIAVETLWTFWALGMVFVWWRPAWLRHLFVSAEKHAVAVTYAAAYAMIVIMLVVFAGAFCVVFFKR